MSKSEDEKAALQSQGGLGTLAAGPSIPSDFMDRMTTTINPIELSSMPSDIREDYAGANVVEAVGKMPSMSDRFGPGGMTTLTGGNFVGSDFGNFGIGMGDMSDFDPTGGLDPVAPSFKPEKQDGFLMRLLKGYARINPKTAPFMMLKDLKDSFEESDGAADFGKKFLTKYATQAATNKLGLSPLTTQGLRTGLAAYKGDITPGQGVASLSTSYGFNKGLPSAYKDAYQRGGMNQVYLTAALAQQLQRAIQKKIFQPGPGGDG
tara:strand:+ start:641 stop:1429 length:789 start_codon:yes stop_codon:yes gene_type:complete